MWAGSSPASLLAWPSPAVEMTDSSWGLGLGWTPFHHLHTQQLAGLLYTCSRPPPQAADSLITMTLSSLARTRVKGQFSPHYSSAASLLNGVDSIAGDTNQMAIRKCLAPLASVSCTQGPVSMQPTLAIADFFILVKMASQRHRAVTKKARI